MLVQRRIIPINQRKIHSKEKSSDESKDNKIKQLELCISELKEEIEEIKKLLEK